MHNTKTLRTGRAVEKVPAIVTTGLAGMAGRFCTEMMALFAGLGIACG